MSMSSIDGSARERVEVGHHEVDRLDAVGRHVGHGARGRSRSARMPPWIGCRVTTRCPRIAGEPVSVGDVGDREAGVGERRGGAAAGHEVPAELDQAPRQLDHAGLVVDGEEGPHGHCILVSRSSEMVLDVEPALDRLDALVEGLDRVVGQDGHRLLGQDRAGVDLDGGDVHGAARDLDPVGSASSHRVPARERREQRRVGVQDPTRERLEDGLGEDGPEPGHGDEVDIRRAAGRRRRGRCRRPGRSRCRSSVRSTSSHGTPGGPPPARRPQGRSRTTRATGRPAMKMARAGSRSPKRAPQVA